MTFNCEYCVREFDTKRSLGNHRRWHKLPQYEEFQRTFPINISKANTGRFMDEEWRRNMGLARMGSKNPMYQIGDKHPHWKGDKAGYDAIHSWVKARKPKPDSCEKCGAINPPRLDLANISQLYLRDVDDYEWLCRRCHLLSDGRMAMLRINCPIKKGTKLGPRKPKSNADLNKLKDKVEE